LNKRALGNIGKGPTSAGFNPHLVTEFNGSCESTFGAQRQSDRQSLAGVVPVLFGQSFIATLPPKVTSINFQRQRPQPSIKKSQKWANLHTTLGSGK
jgi:hypothetical protein